MNKDEKTLALYERVKEAKKHLTAKPMFDDRIGSYVVLAAEIMNKKLTEAEKNKFRKVYNLQQADEEYTIIIEKMAEKWKGGKK